MKAIIWILRLLVAVAIAGTLMSVGVYWNTSWQFWVILLLALLVMPILTRIEERLD